VIIGFLEVEEGRERPDKYIDIEPLLELSVWCNYPE
jgi:hypothetical protein